MSGAADKVVGDVEGDQPAAVHPVDDTADLAHDLGANAVTGKKEQLFWCHERKLGYSWLVLRTPAITLHQQS